MPALVRRVLPCLVLCGCSSFIENIRPVIYGKTAEENYRRGLRALRGESYQDAAKYFQYVRQNWGFSKWATLSELGLADAAMGRQSYIEAIDGYKGFIRSHPSHEKTLDGYCAFKIGEAYYKQIPSDFFLLPPSYEKDQGPVHDAMRELASFLDEHGKSPYAPQARKLYADVLRRLADHELYVARYYLGQNKPQAAIWRLEYVVNHYPGARREPEVLLLLGQVYLKQNKPFEARDTFRRLRIEHPHDFRAAQAQLYLDYIARRYPNLPAPQPLPPRRIEPLRPALEPEEEPAG
ncbi:MAG: outer membrane protein assembly factor BamD [Myxococcales bacterium]|nr:outer membrane protein assembly factor BamD [Myxococcota bacterium]MDW8281599.1 outer membrane protein assembly factor BamD [Myxococcales bacterium]